MENLPPEEGDFRSINQQSAPTALIYERLRSHPEGSIAVARLLGLKLPDWTNSEKSISAQEGLRKIDVPDAFVEQVAENFMFGFESHFIRNLLPYFPQPFLTAFPKGECLSKVSVPFLVHRWSEKAKFPPMKGTLFFTVDETAHFRKIINAFTEWLRSEKTYREGRGDRKKNQSAALKKLSAFRLSNAHFSYEQAQELIEIRRHEMPYKGTQDVLPSYASRSRWDTSVKEAEIEMLEEFKNLAFAAI